jgi:ribonucleoside-diphosphate reductase subunit M1
MLNDVSNIYTRRASVPAGEFQVVCPWLLRELVDIGLWDDNIIRAELRRQGTLVNDLEMFQVVY